MREIMMSRSRFSLLLALFFTSLIIFTSIIAGGVDQDENNLYSQDPNQPSANDKTVIPGGIKAPAGYVHRPLIEFFTGLSCPSCMNGPHPELESIWEENHDKADQPFNYIVFHELNGGGVDDLATDESRERMRHYQPGISGTPDAEFDGGYIELGGLSGGTLNKDTAIGAIEDCKNRDERNINPLHPLQDIRSDFKYLNLFVDQTITENGYAVSVTVEYLGSNAVLPRPQFQGELYVFMVEENAEAYSTVEERTVLNRNVFRGYAMQAIPLSLSQGENAVEMAQWNFPETTIPIRPANVTAIAAVFDTQDTSSQEGNQGNNANVPRCVQSSNPRSTAYDRGNDLPVIGNVQLSEENGINIAVKIDDDDGVSKAVLLYNYQGSNATEWSFIEMNLTGTELCDDSGVCYAFQDSSASANIPDVQGSRIFVQIIAYDGSGIEFNSLGGESRSDIMEFTISNFQSGKDGGSISLDGILIVLIALIILLLLGTMIWIGKSSEKGSSNSKLVNRIKNRGRQTYALFAIIAVLLIITSVYAISSSRTTKAAPEFTLTDIDGNQFNLNDFRGKPVIIDFMATWCPGCNDVMSTLKEISSKYGKEIEIITVDVDSEETDNDLRDFKEKHGADWRFAMDTQNLMLDYNVKVIPKLVIVNGDGDISFVHEGDLSVSELSSEIEKAISGTSTGASISSTTLGLAGFAILVGIGSFFSPCSFPLLPGYMSYYMGDQKKKDLKRALLGGSAAALGLLMVYGIIGIIIGAGGTAIKPFVSILEPIVGVIIIVLGILMLMDVDISRILHPFRKGVDKISDISGTKKVKKKGFFSQYSNLFFYGAGYAGAAAGCTAPLLLAMMFSALSSGGFFKALIIFLIAAGVMGILMIFITVLTAISANTFLQKLKVSTSAIQKVSSVILIGVGIYLVIYFITAMG